VDRFASGVFETVVTLSCPAMVIKVYTRPRGFPC
jgi:hypothetical protein